MEEQNEKKGSLVGVPDTDIGNVLFIVVKLDRIVHNGI